MDTPISRRHHVLRVVGLMAIASVILVVIASRSAIIYADGLRYIDQASRISRGHVTEGFLRAIDHPGYPLAISAVHALIGTEDPLAWQYAAQAAAVLAGVLLVLPLYLIALELVGPRTAWLACLLLYLAPVPSRVMADALSESTFLLFWTGGLLGAIRFLKQGGLGWLPLTIGGAVLAYLTRAEGLLLPAALVACLLLTPLIPAIRLSWPRWAAAVGLLVVLPLCVVGPYVVAKGGLGTKPALARVLGMSAQAPADSVERARPLDPNQGIGKTYAMALKGTAGAVAEAVSLPLIPLAVLGLWVACRRRERSRTQLLLALIVTGAILALTRLHATNGYCTARHALLVGMLGVLAAAAGLEWLARRVVPEGWTVAGAPRPALYTGLALIYLTWTGPALWRPLNEEAVGYRLAGRWLADRSHAPEGTKVVDGPAWSLFYGQRGGYIFANLREAITDPQCRFVVVREAHLAGPWWYCQTFRELVDGLQPVASFPERPAKGQSRVLLFDREGPRDAPARTAGGGRSEEA